MRTRDVNMVDYHTPGLVIGNDGYYVTMESENHDVFFQNILGPLLRKSGVNPRSIGQEHDLYKLTKMLLDEFNYVVYMGCTSADEKDKGNRVFEKGILCTPSLELLDNAQLSSIINLCERMNGKYPVDILQVSMDGSNDKILNIDLINEELLMRKGSKKI